MPRPDGAFAGRGAPWADRVTTLSLADVRAALLAAGPPIRSPREGQVARASAVLAPLYEADGDTWVVLTRRAWHLRAHRGEVSFPGGGQEPGEHLEDTARREACEEIGLDPGAVEIFGELDHLTTITSNSYIVPYVAALPGRPDVIANPDEVEAILHVPLRELLDPATFREEVWPIFGTERRIWFFELAGDTIWGATAAMLRQLLGLATGTIGRGEIGHP